MEKLKGSTAAKIAAIVLSYVMVFLLVISVCSVGIMGYYKFYFSDEETVRYEILTDMAHSEAEYICYRMSNYMDLEEYYKDKNVLYVVEDIIGGNRSQKNYNNEEYITSDKMQYYIDTEYVVSYTDGYPNTDIKTTHVANVTVYIPKDLRWNDTFSFVSKMIGIGFKLKYFMVFAALFSLVGVIIFISFLFCSAGHNRKGEIVANYVDKLPIDIYICAMIFGAVCNYILLGELSYVKGVNDVLASAVFIFFILSIDYFLCLGFLLSLATRIKTGTFLKNSLIYRIVSLICKSVKKPLKTCWFALSNITLVKKTVIFICILLILEAIGIMVAFELYWGFGADALIMPLLTVNIVAVLSLLYFAVVLQRIKQGGERIANGDLEHEIETEYMFWDFKKFANSLNHIKVGLQNAIEDRIKSERFKTELITNVSHDIKTPLTSIINYVDLIKKEDIENGNVREYVDVLDRQSGRLKKLVDDLVEASKASSGNLPVELTNCKVGVILNQSLGEFEERLKTSQITPVLKVADDEMTILADGRHLWRVFDNLLNNVCKYALTGTRVYIDAKNSDNKVQITFRNISKYELNISSEELMERFVRGDKSRNTEGSGLGLSIAKSLTELQGGNFDINIDGDLFKVTVVFDKI